MRKQDEEQQNRDESINKTRPRYINAYYPWNENLARSTQQDILHCEIVEEKQEPLAEFEYSIEIACSLSELTTHQIGAFSLGSTQEEPLISSWEKSESTETGYSILTANVRIQEPKTLYREFFESSGKPLSFSDVQPHKKGSGKISESFVPIKPSVQVYDRLSWPKVGFFYHFIDDELVNEYPLSGGNKWAFKVTHSKADALSNDMLSDHEYGFILLPWKINSTVVARQHLLYTREKITQEQLSEIIPQWLDDNACLLNPDEIVKSCSEPLLERETTEDGVTTYTVQSGDLLSIIAKKHGIKYAEILELNPKISDPNVIRPGDVVVIKENKEDINPVNVHVCQINLATGKRETWGEVAAQYGKSAKELFALNANNPAHKDGALAVGDEVLVNSAMLGNEDNRSFRNTLSPADVTGDKSAFPFANIWSLIEKQYSKLAYLYVQADKTIGDSTAIVKAREVHLQSKVLSTSEALEAVAKEDVDSFKKGSKGDEVKLIQEALLMLNFDLGKYGADGHFGSGTHKAIVSFQEKFIPTHEIHPNYKIKEANGIVDSQTLLAIDEAVAIGWIKPIPPFKWCEPLLNPMSTNYYQSGGGGTKKARAWGLFGKKIRGTSRHDGLDLFAKAGTDVFACVDGEIAMNYKIPGPGYGHVVLLKVAESELMWENRKEFSARKNLTDVELEQYDTFESEYKKNKQLYLMYAHLSSVESKLKVGSSVKVGEIIAKTGVSGIKETGVIKAGTCAPHLHFEVRTKASIPKSDMGRCNPSLFVNFKDYSQQSEAERKQQKDERDKQYKILKK